MTTSRLSTLRNLLQEKHWNACIIPTADPHLSEYLDEHFKFRSFLSGFSGSAGTLVVTSSSSALWTDSRYWEQAQKELNANDITLMKDGESDTPSIDEWLGKQLTPKSQVVVDATLFSQSSFNQLKKALKDKSLELQSTLDLADQVWSERPKQQFSSIFEHSVSPRSRKEKILLVQSKMEQLHVDRLLLTTLDDIAWLTNLRASDIPHNPVFYSYALISKDGSLDLFINPSSISKELELYLSMDKIRIHSYDSIHDYLKNLNEGSLGFDPKQTNAYLATQVSDKVSVLPIANPVTVFKAIKSDEEIALIRQAMLQDGVALVRFLAWLDQEKNSGKLTEVSVAKKLFEYRSALPHFTDISFETIVAFGPNGALPHYRATEKNSSPIQENNFLLIDSGAQFPEGTTDITRTIPVGSVTYEMKRDYTAVLRSHIRLAMAKFPLGISSQAIDAIAREPLWQQMADYGHGTGHGVGFFLNVHEGPQRISYPRIHPGQSATISDATAMQVGMVTSNEPGLYRPNRWGIRIENLVANRLAGSTEFGTFLEFETLTLCPIDLDCVLVEQLLKDEIDWINQYHQRVRDSLYTLVQDDPKTSQWLLEKTKPLSH